MAERVAAVTGATGFIGRAMVQVLAASGWRVRALVRRPPAPGVWGDASPEVVVGDLADGSALRRAFDGADAVVHAAGAVKARSEADFLRVNDEGARAAAEAFTAYGGDGRFVLVSSLVAREPRLSPYARSKRAGEEAVRTVLPPSRLTIVRPPAVYGPGDFETLSFFKAALRSPVLPLPGTPDARVALVHVSDAVDEIVRLVERSDAAPLATLGGDRPEGYGWRAILEAAAAAVGRRPSLIRAPATALGLAGFAAEQASRLDGRTRMLTLGKVRELRHPDWSVHADELGPERRSARFGLEAGFADAVAWYRREGWLPLERGKASL